MQATKQQQIVVYFIEEAKEHLDTIEQGLLSLQATMADMERLNELFRAAHSVKGGAAMLGFNGIQKVGHHLEDCFKLLKDNPVKVDPRLEDLFLQCFDVLKELIEGLQSPYGLSEQDAQQAVQKAEPTFVELETYLNGLIRGAASQPLPTATRTAPKASANASKDLFLLVNGALKKMLQLFKQGDSTGNRQQVATLCGAMMRLHSSAEWQDLLQTAQRAIANHQSAYPVLAPLVIKELKQASDLLIAGRGSEIMPSQRLRQLGFMAKPGISQPPVTKPAPVSNGVLPTTGAAIESRDAATATRPPQISIPLEPRAAARALLESFNKEQLIEIAEFLMKSIQ